MNEGDVSDFAKALGTEIDVNADDGEDDRSVDDIVRECQEEFPDFTVPTILAAICSDELGLTTLVRRHKLDVNQVDKDGCTAARAAAEFGNADILATLASLGADLDRPDNNGESPAYVAAEHEGGTLLRLLRCAGCDMDRAADNGDTPAHMAAANGDMDCLQALVEEDYAFTGGPDSRIQVKPSNLAAHNPKTGKTPADVASAAGHAECAAFIAQACAAVTASERLSSLVLTGDFEGAMALEAQSQSLAQEAGTKKGGSKKKAGGGGKQQQGTFYHLFRSALEAVSSHRLKKELEEADRAMASLILEDGDVESSNSTKKRQQKGKAAPATSGPVGETKGCGPEGGAAALTPSDEELLIRLIEVAGEDWIKSSPAKLRAALTEAGITNVSEKRVKGLKNRATSS
jgi:ankyrin repeat protein